MRYAIFLEPTGRVRDLLVSWKNRVAGQWPEAVYLTAPPHCTIWAGELVEGAAAAQAVADAAATLDVFPVTLTSPWVFSNDVLAAGGQTCVFLAGPAAPLARLQGALCDVIAPWRKAMRDADLPAPLRHGVTLESWRRFGFPFVGPHWQPHFTVASLPVPRDAPAVAEFLETPVDQQMETWQLGWWRVSGDRHEWLASLPLRGSAREAERR